MLAEATLSAILEIVISRSIRPVRTAIAKWRRPRPALNWIPRLNSEFREQVVIYGDLLRSEPRIILKGTYPLDADRKLVAARQRLKLINEGKRNDPHAVLVNTPKWNFDPVYLEAQTLYFSEVRALRDKNLGSLKPNILSANAVFFCSETKQLILHERSEQSDTFNRLNLHTLGGAYQPPHLDGTEGDRLSLMHTARREVLEEGLAGLVWEEEPPMLMMQELDTGFVQLVLLGINISAKAAQRLQGSWEGRIVSVHFNDLERTLTSDVSWVPTGKVQVLAWLALSAPNANPKVRFGNLSAVELFNKIVK